MKHSSRPLRVLMIGPSLEVKGGMTSVSKAILSHQSKKYDVEFAKSMTDSSLIGRINHWFFRLISSPFRAVLKRPDVVHIHVSNRLSVWRKLSILAVWRIFRVPVILHTHGSGAKKHLGEMKGLRKHLMKFGFRSAAFVIVLSKSWSKFYSDICGVSEDKIRILHNPVLLPKRPNLKSNNPIIVLYTGVIGKRKGAFDLIEAWAAIPVELRRKCKLIIAGNGDVEKANSLIENLNIGETCEAPGWISDEKRDYYLQTGSIYILPSYNEGLPMGILEAMGHEMAVISTRVGGIPDLIENGKNGVLVGPGNIEELTKGIHDLIRDERKRKLMAEQARKDVSEFDIENYMLELGEIWHLSTHSSDS